MGRELNQNEIDKMLQELNRGEEEPGKAPAGGDDPAETGEKEKGTVVEKVEFAPLKPRYRSHGKKVNIKYFDSIPLVVSGELGTAEITVRELLDLEEGSVIMLNKMAGESASILLNDQYLGQAEVVVINDRFGLRVTAIGAEKEQESAREQEAEAAKAEDARKAPDAPTGESGGGEEGHKEGEEAQ